VAALKPSSTILSLQPTTLHLSLEKEAFPSFSFFFRKFHSHRKAKLNLIHQQPDMKNRITFHH